MPRNKQKFRIKRNKRAQNTGSAGRLIDAIRNESRTLIDDVFSGPLSDGERQRLLDLGLCYSCQHGPDEFALWFLAHGADTSCELITNRLRPLSLAAYHGRTRILQSLLNDHGCEADARDKYERTALMYARDTEAVEILLRAGASLKAKDHKGNTALIVALLHHRKTRVIRLLIEKNAPLEACDARGRTVLVQAVWKNRMPIIRMLLDRKVNMAQKDHRKRNIFHHLASDMNRADENNPKRRSPKPSARHESLIRMLLDADLSGELANAQDELERTTLHWAAVSGNSRLVQMLVNRSKASVNRPERKKRTALHFAVANNHTKTVKILLENQADVNAKTDAGLTPLHVACACLPAQTSTVASLVEVHKAKVSPRNRSGETALHLAAQAGNWPIVEYLLRRPVIDVNAKTDAGMSLLHLVCAHPTAPVSTVKSLVEDHNAKADLKNRRGKTALHLAAQAGNWPVVEHLFRLPSLDLQDRDDFSNTPLIYAASHRNDESKDRRKIIEAFSPWRNPKTMTSDARSAAMECEAIIMDFRRASGTEPKVMKRSVYELIYASHPKDHDRPALTISHPESTSFRWIHLPANNIAWCLDLLTKDFIEKDAVDLHTFIALEKSFNHQHRGLEPHSKYMTPLCQTIIRSWSRSNAPPIEYTDPRPSIAAREEDELLAEASAALPRGARRSSAVNLPKKNLSKLRTKSWPKARKTAQQNDDEGQSHDATISSMYLFTPFLHFETLEERQEMQRHADRVFEKTKDTPTTSVGGALFRAHLRAPDFPLHMRRTLDQFFYRNIDTTDRDKDQVIHRYQTKPEVFHRDHPVKLLMVDQLWMWVLHDDLVLTSFPQRWNTEKRDLEDRSGTWEDIREVILSRNRDPVRDVHELALIIAGQCFGAFDRHRLGSHGLQFLDMFEASIGDALNEEVKLFENFNNSSEKAVEWLSSDLAASHEHSHGIRGTGRRTPDFIKDLFDIASETNLLKDIKDIIDELDMLTMLFECQEHQVLPHMKDAITEIGDQHKWSKAIQQKVSKAFVEHQRTIAHPKQDIARMKKLATRIERSIKDLLDLKQKQVNVIEARASRTQAESTVSQGNILMIFTTFSVIFLPLSFIASFFTINISSLPQGNNGNLLSLGFVAKYMFGIGIPIAISCVLIASGIDRVAVYFWRGWSRLMQWAGEQHAANVERSHRRNPYWRQMVAGSIPPLESDLVRRSKALTRIGSAPVGGWNTSGREPQHSGLHKSVKWNLGQPLQPPKPVMRARVISNGYTVC